MNISIRPNYTQYQPQDRCLLICACSNHIHNSDNHMLLPLASDWVGVVFQPCQVR